MDKNAPFCVRMLHHHGFITRSDITAKFAGISGDNIGRADIFASRMGNAVFIEVKRGINGFMLSNWRNNQREWAEMVSKAPFLTPYYMFLTLGKHPPTYNTKSYLPKRSWLIPYKEMIKICDLIEPIQKTLPMRLKKGMKKALRENKYDAINLLKSFELKWNGSEALMRPAWFFENANKPYGSFWTVPEEHIFYRRFIENTTENTDLN